jgi:hypothetical protein
MVRRRLEAAQGETEIAVFSPIIQPQEQREALMSRLAQEARSIADTVINRFGLQHRGRDLLRCFSGDHNSAILIRLASAEQNKVMGVGSGERHGANIDQLKHTIDASPDIADKLSSLIREKMKDATPQADG